MFVRGGTAMSDGAERRWIPRETWRQEGATRWVKSAVLEPKEFFAFDRDKRDGKSHLWEAKRGVRKSTLDTLLRWPGVPAWFEFKAGNRVPDEDQSKMINRLRSFGDRVSWGYTIVDLWHFYHAVGVPMTANAEYQALHYDGLVNSRIAKEEAKQAGLAPPKKSRATRTAPRFTAGKRLARRMNQTGMG